MSNNLDLVVTALQQRMGEVVSNYELQIAILRAELTSVVQQLNEISSAKQKDIEDFEAELAEKLS